MLERVQQLQAQYEQHSQRTLRMRAEVEARMQQQAATEAKQLTGSMQALEKDLHSALEAKVRACVSVCACPRVFLARFSVPASSQMYIRAGASGSLAGPDRGCA